MNVFLPSCKWDPGTTLLHIQGVRDSYDPSLDRELWNLRFVSVDCVKCLCSDDSPLPLSIYASQKTRYDLSGERNAEDLMVLPMGNHSQVVQNRPKKHHDLSVIIGELVIGDNTRFHAGLDQVSENLQSNVRDDSEMDSTMI